METHIRRAREKKVVSRRNYRNKDFKLSRPIEGEQFRLMKIPLIWSMTLLWQLKATPRRLALSKN
jgi:hypothetical protein